MSGSQGINQSFNRIQNLHSFDLSSKNEVPNYKDSKVLQVSSSILSKIIPENTKNLNGLSSKNQKEGKEILFAKSMYSLITKNVDENSASDEVKQLLKTLKNSIEKVESKGEAKKLSNELSKSNEKLEGMIDKFAGQANVKTMIKDFRTKNVEAQVSEQNIVTDLREHLKQMHAEGQLFTHDSEGNEIPWSEEQLNEFLELATLYVIVQIKMEQIDELIAQLEEKEIHEDRHEGFHVVVNLRNDHHDRGKADEKAYLDSVARLDQLRSLLKISQKAQKSLKDNRVEMFELDKEQTEKFLRILNESIKKEDLNKAILRADENLRVSKAQIVKHEDTTIVEITFKRRIVGTSDKVIKLYAVFNPKGLSKQAAA